MLQNTFVLVAALALVVKSATLATKYAANLADSFRLSRYVIGFIVVAVISIMPETFIAVGSALEGNPALGLGTLFGGNVADLTVVFTGVLLLSGRGIQVESRMLKENNYLPFLMLAPVALGLDGNFTRLEGLALITSGIAFYYLSLRGEEPVAKAEGPSEPRLRNLLLLLASMAGLLLGSHFTISSASDLALGLGVSSTLIGILIVGIGTTLPEFFFALKAVRKHDDSLAVGDIFGTVLADATVVIGLVAVISPFTFPARIVYSAGVAMVLASVLLLHFMRTGKTLTRKEGWALFGLWVAFAVAEFLIS